MASRSLNVRAARTGRVTPKRILEVLISRAKNGGHVVEHHFDNSGPGVGFRQPEQHVFGPGSGRAMLAHVGKVMGVNAAAQVPMQGQQQGEE